MCDDNAQSPKNQLPDCAHIFGGLISICEQQRRLGIPLPAVSLARLFRLGRVVLGTFPLFHTARRERAQWYRASEIFFLRSIGVRP